MGNIHWVAETRAQITSMIWHTHEKHQFSLADKWTKIDSYTRGAVQLPRRPNPRSFHVEVACLDCICYYKKFGACTHLQE